MRTTPLLLTAALATLLTAPIAQAKPPASLNDCQAYIQFVSQVYHYTSTCGETHGGKNVAALVERNKAKLYGYQTVCLIKNLYSLFP